MNKLEWIFLGLGSNLGKPATQIESAIEELKRFSHEPALVSSLWMSGPVDCPPDSPDFVNAVLGIRLVSNWEPIDLLQRLQRMERRFGERDHSLINSPRYLDLDILLWGDRQIEIPDLVIPHPRACQRSFVMQPLAELVPDLSWPGIGQTVSELADAMGRDGVRCIVSRGGSHQT